MDKPRLELRRLTTNERLSEETMCFAADLYVDGALFAHISNHGHGGCDEQRPAQGRAHADIAALDARVKATFEPWTFDGKTFETDLEMACAKLVEDAAALKRIRRLLKGKVAFFETAPTEGKRAPLYTMGGSKWPVESVIPKVRAKYPNAVILNEQSEEEALRLYRLAA